MKRALANAVENKAKPMKAGVRRAAHLAKEVAANPLTARQLAKPLLARWLATCLLRKPCLKPSLFQKLILPNSASFVCLAKPWLPVTIGSSRATYQDSSTLSRKQLRQPSWLGVSP
jgi:hypothetical protein